MSAPRMSSLSVRALVASAAALSLTFAGLVIAESAAAATTIAVTTTADGDANGACTPGSTQTSTASPVTLRNALCVASNLGGEVTVTVPGGDYVLTQGALAYGEHPGSDLLLTGVPGDQAKIRGNGSTQLLALDPDLVGDIAVEIMELQFHGGHDDLYGGGAIIGGSAGEAAPDTLYVHNTWFYDNASTAEGAPGGAIQFIGGDLTIRRVGFSGNDSGASSGGAVYFEARADGDDLTIDGSTFISNSTQPVNGVPAGGGAVAFDSYGSGGAVPASTVSITRNIFRGDNATSADGTATPGGAILQLHGAATISSNYFRGTDASDGAAILHAAAGTLTSKYNSFARSSGTAVRTSAAVPATLTDNWWGCNGGPSTTGCPIADVANGSVWPHIVMLATATPTTISTGETAELTVTLDHNSAGASLGAFDLTAFDNETVDWDGIAPADADALAYTSFANGRSDNEYTAGSTGGPGSITAHVNSASATLPITVREAVTFTSPTIAGAVTNQPFSFTIQASGFPAPTLTPLTGALPQGLTATPSGSSIVISGTPTQTGTFVLATTATNGGPVVNHSLVLTVGSAPVFGGPSSLSVPEGAPVDVTLTASGAPTPTITATGVPAGLTLVDNGDGTAHLHGTPTVAPGAYVVNLSLANGIQTTPAPFTLTITADAAITSANHTTFTVGAAGSFPVTFDDGFPVPVPNTLSLVGAPSWVSLDPSNNLVGTPPAGSGGTHTFSVRLSGASTIEQIFTLTVNEAPVVTTQPAPVSVREGTDAVFTAAAAGYPAPTVQWQRYDGGAWADIAGATATTLTLPTTITDTGSRVRAIFTNGSGSTISSEAVLTVGRAPALSPVDAVTVLVGAPLSQIVEASGTAVVRLTASALPSWLTITDAGDGTATLTGTPGLGDVGTVDIEIAAENDYGTDSLTVSVTVSSSVPLPGQLPQTSDGRLTGVPDPVEQGQRITVGGSGFLPGTTVTVGMYSLPTLLGTAVADQAGEFSVEVTIPSTHPLGAHTVAASGIGADSEPWLLTAGTTVIAKSVVTPPTPRPGSGLATTGPDAQATTGLVLLALISVLGGLALIRGARRRMI